MWKYRLVDTTVNLVCEAHRKKASYCSDLGKDGGHFKITCFSHELVEDLIETIMIPENWGRFSSKSLTKGRICVGTVLFSQF